MYYHHRDSFAGDLVGLGLVLCLIAAFFVVKALLFVLRTFVKYYQHRSLWIALAVCVVLSTGSILLLAQDDQSAIALPIVGIGVLLITCLVVDLRNRDTLMRESVNLIDEVLHTSWLASEDTPRMEQEHVQRAA